MLRSIQVFKHTMGSNPGLAIGFALSPNGRFFLVQGQDMEDGPVSTRLFDLENGKLLREFDEKTIKPTCRAVSPDGKLGLFGYQERDAIVLDLEKGKAGWTLKETPRRDIGFTPLSFSPEGTKILIQQLDKKKNPSFYLQVWDLASKEKTQEMPSKFGYQQVDISWPEEKRLLLQDGLTEGDLIGSEIVFFDLENKRVTKRQKIMPARLAFFQKLAIGRIHDVQVGRLSFSRNGKKLITGSFGYLLVWDLENGNVEKILSPIPMR